MHEERLAKNLNSFYRRLIHTVIIREMKEWIKKRLGEITLKIFTVFLLFFISVILFGLLAHIVVWRKEDLFDSKAFIFFSIFFHSWFLTVNEGNNLFWFQLFFGTCLHHYYHGSFSNEQNIPRYRHRHHSPDKHSFKDLFEKLFSKKQARASLF